MIRAGVSLPALAGACLLALLASCSTTQRPAPVVDRGPQAKSQPAKPVAAAPKTRAAEADWRPAFYTVKRGDTLYSIALDHGINYRDLAAWNGIDNPASIQTGQQLRLTPPSVAASPVAPPSVAQESGAVTAPFQSAPVVQGRPDSASAVAPPLATASTIVPSLLKTEPKAMKLPYSDQALAQLQAGVKPEPAAQQAKLDEKPAVAPPSDTDINWAWPVTGKLLASYSESSNSKGLDIAGKLGEPIHAAAPGTVLYSGSGIRGYGKLIVIKHAGGFSSVYAHNSEILVKEGQAVSKGQKIGEMGSTDADQVKLHFEIRRLGKPVDPVKLLPAS